MNEEKEKEMLTEIKPQVDDSAGVLCEELIKIFDPETDDIQFEGRG